MSALCRDTGDTVTCSGSATGGSDFPVSQRFPLCQYSTIKPPTSPRNSVFWGSSQTFPLGFQPPHHWKGTWLEWICLRPAGSVWALDFMQESKTLCKYVY